jgi:hypothetical protein
VRPLASALSRALSHPENGSRLRLRRCGRLRSPHRIFACREEAENALFKWSMTLWGKGSETVGFLNVFRCGDHWHIGRLYLRQGVRARRAG